MKFSDQDLDIIAFTYLNADLPEAAVARELNLKPNTVRYAIQKLIDNEAIFKVPIINPFQVGLIPFQIFIDVLSSAESDVAAFTKLLQESSQTVWVGQVSGNFQLEIIIFVKSTYDVSSFFQDFSRKVPNLEFQYELAYESAITYFAPRFLSDSVPWQEPLRFGYDGETSDIVELDKISERILINLAKNPTLRTSELARQMEVPASTVNYRIESLKEQRIILGFANFVNCEALGFLDYNLVVRLKKYNADFISRVYEFAKAEPSIFAAVENTGAWDLQLGVRFKESSELRLLIQRLRSQFSDEILEVSSLHALETLKLKMY